jgi:uncharacterized lipoprotein YddW (UPF0748 family)
MYLKKYLRSATKSLGKNTQKSVHLAENLALSTGTINRHKKNAPPMKPSSPTTNSQDRNQALALALAYPDNMLNLRHQLCTPKPRTPLPTLLSACCAASFSIITILFVTLMFGASQHMSAQEIKQSLGKQPHEKKSNQQLARQGTEPVRGVWLTNVDSKALLCRDSIEAAVRLCRDLGFNTIYAVVWNRSHTLYPSQVMKRLTGVEIDPVMRNNSLCAGPQCSDRDPLQELILAAKPHKIRVVAWFEFGFSCSYGDSTGGAIIQTKPHWASRGANGKIVSKNNFQWMNAFHPEVQDFMLSLLKEVATRYDVAGIQGDDRLPAVPSESGYDSLTAAIYKAETGSEPPVYHKDYEWVRWRADRLNAYMQRIHTELKAIKPQLVISMSPSIYPWSVGEYLQDWVTWLREGWVDEVCPQVYRYKLDGYKRELDKIVQSQVAARDRGKVVPGVLLKVGEYYASEDYLRAMIAHNRFRGIDGEVMFFYEGIKRYPEVFKELYAETRATTKTTPKTTTKTTTRRHSSEQQRK